MINYENKLKEIKNNIFFTYNDFNFVAVRKFSEEERAFVDSVVSNEQNKKLLSKNSLYYAGFLESQKPVSEQNFEKALKVFNKTDFLQSSNSDSDIFYCREKGTFYTALNNDFLVPLEFVYSSDRQEKEVFENRFSGEIESFRNDNFDFLKGTLSYELDEEKDFALMSDISYVLSEGEVFTRRNVNIDGEIKIKLGDLFDKKNPGKIQPTGLRHLIKHRMEERLNNGLSMEDAQRETTAILFLALNNIDKAPAVKEQNGRYAIYKDGIKTLIGKDKKGKYVVSGFDYIDTKREATDSIGTGIARYGYTPGFLEIYDQVGAVASELNIHKENSVVNKNENTNTSIEKSKISNITKFEYDGLTYIPIRALSGNEKELINNQTPKNYWSNSIIEKTKNGENYSIEDFKKKSQSQDIDLFYCIERGKFFTPVENGIINLNEGSIDEHFRKELSNFYNNENIQELIKNHRPLVFNEKEDISLMKNISSVLTESEVFYKNNETLGNIRVKFGNLKHGGVIHIIKRRMDKLIKHEGMNYDDAVKETSAILFLSLQNISNAPATKETDGRYAIYKDGIKTAIGKDKNGRYVVTGFNFNDTKQEAADAIKSVNALYGYTPGFLEIYDQVGAVASELNIHKENSVVNKNENTNTSIEKSKISNITKFEYDGLTYIPIRALSENEKELINNQTPKNYWSNSIIEKPKNGENYSIEDFKKKSQSQDIDLFYCIERGKFFTPVENGIINLNEGSIDEHFRKELSNFYNNENIQELIKNHRPLVFNKKEDISLMKSISSVLTESEVFYKNNETLGDVRIRFGNPGHNGLSHIIKRRMDKLIKHEGMNYDDAVKETSAILFLSLQNISNAPATKEINGRYAIYKNGIKTAIDTDKNGKFVVTGFNFNDTKQEAADAIKSVNALYGYTPEFLDIYAQVGAAYASLNNNITQQNSPVNDKKSDYEKLLYSSAEINVNGTIRHCKDGLIKGFENAVSRLESYFAENSSLKNENARLKSQIECMNSKCEKLIQDNEELKKQALKNKIRPMGM